MIIKMTTPTLPPGKSIADDVDLSNSKVSVAAVGGAAGTMYNSVQMGKCRGNLELMEDKIKFSSAARGLSLQWSKITKHKISPPTFPAHKLTVIHRGGNGKELSTNFVFPNCMSMLEAHKEIEARQGEEFTGKENGEAAADRTHMAIKGTPTSHCIGNVVEPSESTVFAAEVDTMEEEGNSVPKETAKEIPTNDIEAGRTLHPNPAPNSSAPPQQASSTISATAIHRITSGHYITGLPTATATRPRELGNMFPPPLATLALVCALACFFWGLHFYL